MDDIQAKIVAHLNDELSEEESRELSEWICLSPENAKEFSRVALMHGQLRSLLKGEKAAKESGAITANPSSVDGNASRTGSGFEKWLLALAASLIFGASVYFAWQPGNKPLASDEFATIGHLSNAVFKTVSLEEDMRIGSQTIELVSGVLRLQLDSGVDITLEGPAKYELVSAQSTHLSSGVLVASAPEDGEGFEVVTPSAKVTDLGTTFGLNVGESGVSDVLVFDGEVEVFSKGAKKAKKVIEGESVRLGPKGKLESTVFDVSRFNNVWPVSSGVSFASDSMQFLPPSPRRLNWLQSDTTIFVAGERRNTKLKRPVAVNISEPGEYASEKDLTPKEISAGRKVRSYVLHYLPEDPRRRRDTKPISGTITFERPVLGVIVLQNELSQTNRIFSRKRNENPTKHPKHRRELELTDKPNGDVVTLSADRKTLTVKLTAHGRGSDLIRVIVENEKQPRVKRKKKSK